MAGRLHARANPRRESSARSRGGRLPYCLLCYAGRPGRFQSRRRSQEARALAGQASCTHHRSEHLVIVGELNDAVSRVVATVPPRQREQKAAKVPTQLGTCRLLMTTRMKAVSCCRSGFVSAGLALAPLLALSRPHDTYPASRPRASRSELRLARLTGPRAPTKTQRSEWARRSPRRKAQRPQSLPWPGS